MGELAEAAGVSAGTIKHYLREGLLPEPVKTSRNMAWYPREFVERVQLIKQLQEERFLPLKVIKEVLSRAGRRRPEQLRAMIELEERVLERALCGQDTRAERARSCKRYGLPAEALERLEKLGVLTPRVRNGAKRYGPDDVQIIEAVGPHARVGLLRGARLHRARHDDLQAPPRAARARGGRRDDGARRRRDGHRRRPPTCSSSAVEPMRDLVAALRAKLLVSELQARRAAQQS